MNAEIILRITSGTSDLWTRLLVWSETPEQSDNRSSAEIFEFAKRDFTPDRCWDYPERKVALWLGLAYMLRRTGHEEDDAGHYYELLTGSKEPPTGRDWDYFLKHLAENAQYMTYEKPAFS